MKQSPTHEIYVYLLRRPEGFMAESIEKRIGEYKIAYSVVNRWHLFPDDEKSMYAVLTRYSVK